jgi:tripartite-type tricarboxylate transporter receptor subunit TctC
LLATGPYVLVLRKNFEASTVAELIARAKANPGKITSATPGVGSVGHLSTVERSQRPTSYREASRHLPLLEVQLISI